MPVIKGYTASGMMKEAIVLDLGDLGRQAARMQAAAEAKARKTISDAELEASRLIDDAKSKGHAEGHAEGLTRGIKEGREIGRQEAFKHTAPQLQQIQQAWTAAIQEWEALRSEIDREARQSIIDISLAVAEKLVHRIIEVDASVIVDQLGQAMSFILQPMDVVVRISPQDRAILEEAMPQLRAEFSNVTSIKLIEDPAMNHGGCVVSYGQGQIDASIETQIRRLTELMLPGQPVDTIAPDAGSTPHNDDAIDGDTDASPSQS